MSRPYQVLVVFVVLSVLCGGWLYWRESGQAEPGADTPDGGVGKVPDGVEALRQQAHAFQKEAKWCDAKDTWERLRGALRKTSEYDALRGEVERNPGDHYSTVLAAKAAGGVAQAARAPT